MRFVDTADFAARVRAEVRNALAGTTSAEPVPFAKIKAPSAFDSGHNYVKALIKRGYSIIGSGNFCTVLAKEDSDRVIKVNSNCTGDDWVLYAKYAQTIKSPYAIKVYSIKQHKNFYVAVMERIYDTAGNLRWQTNQPVPTDENIIDTFGWIRSHVEYNSCSRIGDSIGSVGAMAQVKYAEAKFPGLHQYLRLLRRNGLLDDLHDQNWGYRPDGTVVIFDPCHKKNATKSRNIAQKFKSTRYKRAA